MEKHSKSGGAAKKGRVPRFHIGLTDDAIAILLTCCEIGSWSVTPDNLVDVAALLCRGFVHVYDNGEGLSAAAEDAGRQWSMKQKLLKPDPTAMFQPFTRTNKGEHYQVS